MPSWSLYNALSCGRVVLASDVTPVREVIEPGVTGLVENLFDVEKLVGDSDVGAGRPGGSTDHSGLAGRQLVERRYSEEVCHPELKDYFEAAWPREARLLNDCA